MTSMTALGSIARASMVTEEGMAASSVILQPHEATFVRETQTGLSFAPDTPIEIWALLTVRLIVQHKRIEWALADAINFGELAYADYEQWVQETGLGKRTLQNYARIGRAIEPARRRADVSFAHHAEVITLPVPEQESLLNAAERAGMTRYDLRDAVRERKRQLEGRAVTPEGAPVEPADDLPWTPSKADLAEDARLALEVRLSEMSASKRSTFEAGWLQALVWADHLAAFKRDGES